MCIRDRGGAARSEDERCLQANNAASRSALVGMARINGMASTQARQMTWPFAALQDVAQHRLHANRTVVVVCEEVDRTAHIGSFNMSSL